MLGIRSPREGGGWKTESGLESHLLLSDIGLLSHATIDSYLDQSVKTTASPTFNQGNFTTLHTTTLLVDHIGEHTGSHSIVFDNPITLGTLGSAAMALTGEAYFTGTNSTSHFNYGTGENTYLRGGKTGAAVYINDTHNGPVNIGAGGLVTFGSNVVMGGQDIYKSANDAALVLNGGNGSGVGAHTILFGGTHASLPSYYFARGAHFRAENVAGTAAYFYHNGSDFYISTGNLYSAYYNMSGTYASTGTPVIHHTNGFLYDLSSSERFKDSIRSWTSENFKDFLLVAPIKFRYKVDKPEQEIKVNPDVIGFSAEELHNAGFADLVNYDNDSLPYSLREHGILAYHHLILRDLDSRLSKLESVGGPK